MTDAALRQDVINLRAEMNAVKAECYAHQILVGDLTSALIYDRPDWRERLGILRQNAIQAARNFELIGGDEPANAALKKEIERRIDEHFSWH